MKRYVLKINDSSYVNSLDWIIGEIPRITTSSFEDALLIREEYLNKDVGYSGFGSDITIKELILRHYPAVKFVPVKIVIDE